MVRAYKDAKPYSKSYRERFCDGSGDEDTAGDHPAECSGKSLATYPKGYEYCGARIFDRGLSGRVADGLVEVVVERGYALSTRAHG